MSRVKCECGEFLKVEIAYDGCDWESEAGEGSGYNYTIFLSCPNCPNIYDIGKLKNEFDFSPISR